MLSSYHSISNCIVDCRQLGIVSFGPLQPYMLDLYTGSHAALPTLPGVPTLAAALDRNWSSSESSKSPTAPALVGFPLPCLMTAQTCCTKGGFSSCPDKLPTELLACALGCNFCSCAKLMPS